MAWSVQRKVRARICAPKVGLAGGRHRAPNRGGPKRLRVSDYATTSGNCSLQTEVNMTKLMSIFAASALALSLSGVAFSADTQDQSTPKTQDQSNSPRPQDPSSTPPDQANRIRTIW